MRAWGACGRSSILRSPTKLDIEGFRKKVRGGNARALGGFYSDFPPQSAIRPTNPSRLFWKANGGSFQFFPQMILFRKNHWTKPVFPRGERLNPFAQGFDPIVSLSLKIRLPSLEVCFGSDKLVLFGKISFLFNASVQKGVYQSIKFAFRFLNLPFQILGERLRRLDIFFFPDFHLRQHLLFPVFAQSDF